MIAEIVLSAQLLCLAEAVYHEARSEGYHAMIAVGLVVHNRALDPKFPDTICEVLEQPHQFAYLPDGTPAGTLPMHEEEAKEEAIMAANAIITLDETPSAWNVLYFHTVSSAPAWDYDKLEPMFEIGGHRFYADASD